MTDPNPQGTEQEQDAEKPADVEDESGAGYGNHGDAEQGNTAGAGQDGDAGVSGGMSDTDRG